MKKWNLVIAISLLACSMMGTGCIRAVRTGFADGVNSALSGVVDTLLTDLLTPATDE